MTRELNKWPEPVSVYYDPMRALYSALGWSALSSLGFLAIGFVVDGKKVDLGFVAIVASALLIVMFASRLFDLRRYWSYTSGAVGARPYITFDKDALVLLGDIRIPWPCIVDIKTELYPNMGPRPGTRMELRLAVDPDRNLEWAGRFNELTRGLLPNYWRPM